MSRILRTKWWPHLPGPAAALSSVNLVNNHWMAQYPLFQNNGKDPWSTWTYDTENNFAVGAFVQAGIEISLMS